MDHSGDFLLGFLVALALDVVLRAVEAWRKRRRNKARKGVEEMDPWNLWSSAEVVADPPALPSSQDKATMGRVRYGVNRPGRGGVRGHKPR
jgi:hypothetical protein